MDIAEIELEDGRVLELEVSEGTTEQQIRDYLSSNPNILNEIPDESKQVPESSTRSREEIMSELARVQPSGNMSIIQPLVDELKATPDPGGLISSVVEPAFTIGSSIAAEPLAGVAGIAQSLNPFASPGAGARAVEGTREALTFQPKSEAGKAGLQAVGEALAPIGEAIGGLEESLGQGAFEATGSPVLAAAAEATPTLIGEALGLGIAGKSLQALNRSKIRRGASKQILLDKIKAGDADKSLLGLRESGGKIFKDKSVKDAIKQGADEAVLRSIETANPATKSNMKQMIKILKKRRQDADFRVINRSSDPVGSSVFKRYKLLDKLRKKAGEELKSAARTDLKGKSLSVADDINKFYDDLDNIGIRRTEDIKNPLDYSGLDDVNEAGARRVLSKLLPRLDDSMDALEAHKAKKLIDSAVKYGALPTADTALPKALESSLKTLRASINDKIAKKSASYAKANRRFKDAVEPLTEMDKMFKNMLGLKGDEAIGSAVGVKASRTLMSNNISRGAMIDLLQETEKVLKKYGVAPKDDIIKQTVMIDEIERLFGTQASTSLGGSAQRSAEKGIKAAMGGDAKAAGIDLLGTAVDKLRGVNEENAIKAIEKILEVNK